MRLRISAFLLLALLLVFAGPVFADSWTFAGSLANTVSPPITDNQSGGLSTSLTYTSALGTSITLYGQSGSGALGGNANLWRKSFGDGSGDVGVATIAGPNNEIGTSLGVNYFVVVDLLNAITALGSPSSVTFTINLQSLDPNESALLSEGTSQTSVAGSTNSVTVANPPSSIVQNVNYSFNTTGGNRFLYVQAANTSSSVLLYSITDTPEPANVLLLGTGLLGLGSLLRKKLSK